MIKAVWFPKKWASTGAAAILTVECPETYSGKREYVL